MNVRDLGGILIAGTLFTATMSAMYVSLDKAKKMIPVNSTNDVVLYFKTSQPTNQYESTNTNFKN